MVEDLFQFWARCRGDERVHPDDRDVLQRTQHSFDLRCLPSPYVGRLCDAPVVVLFLAPGFHPYDLQHAKQHDAQVWHAGQRTGKFPLSEQSEHKTHYQWWTRIVRQFGIVPNDDARQKIAILDIAPYHSASFSDWHMLSALPSARKAIDWAQSSLFPEAISGNRLVVCLRAAGPWGLTNAPEGRVFGQALYCPRVTRGGMMLRGTLRDGICAQVQERLA